MDTTSRGWIIDLVESIGEQLAAASHLSEKLLLLDKERRDLVIDPTAPDTREAVIEEKRQKTLWLRDTVVQSRRSKMNFLYEYAADQESKDHDYWCVVKHLTKNLINTVEVYDAVENEMRGIMYEEVETAYSLLAGALGLFLGLEIPACWACLSDKLLSKK